MTVRAEKLDPIADRDERRQAREIDGVMASTPDHTHAIITSSALSSGRHVYCEKPLAHTIAEVRHVTELARKKGLATQIGTSLMDLQAGLIWRKVCRREPNKLSRSLQALASRLAGLVHG